MHCQTIQLFIILLHQCSMCDIHHKVLSCQHRQFAHIIQFYFTSIYLKLANCNSSLNSLFCFSLLYSSQIHSIILSDDVLVIKAKTGQNFRVLELVEANWWHTHTHKHCQEGDVCVPQAPMHTHGKDTDEHIETKYPVSNSNGGSPRVDADGQSFRLHRYGWHLAISLQHCQLQKKCRSMISSKPKQLKWGGLKGPPLPPLNSQLKMYYPVSHINCITA